MENEKTIIAGAEVLPDADNNMPPEEKTTCQHEFIIEKTILHKKTLLTSVELLASVIFCKKCVISNQTTIARSKYCRATHWTT